MLKLVIVVAIVWSVTASLTSSDFRLSRYNIMFQKAATKLPQEMLEKLKMKFSKLDEEEIKIKHLSAKGLPGIDEMKKSVEMHLKDVLKEFNLEDILVTDYSKVQFADERLNELWKQALAASYSMEELRSLHEEVQHMQEKMNVIHTRSVRVEGKDSNNMVDVPSENDITDHANIQPTQEILNNEMNYVNKKVEKMQEKVRDRLDSPDYHDIRVLKLWDRARLSGKFEQEELASIKTELKHFQTRIDKLNHWEDESKRLHKEIKEEGRMHLQDEYRMSKEKIAEHKKYVKKYHATMINKLSPKAEL